MASDEEIDSLFENAMNGGLQKQYQGSSSQAHQVQRDEIALELVKTIPSNADDSNASTAVLSIANDRGNTPLHLAARVGNVQVCHSIAAKAASLVSLGNVEGETPLFLAALKRLFFAFISIAEKNTTP
ncbi:hypothetical protein ACLB2K_037663 [Fragaria x ananassa]